MAEAGTRTKPLAPVPAREFFGSAVAYLLTNGWWRDGDDLGAWIDPLFRGSSHSFGDALTLQLERDGINMLDDTGDPSC